jgi:hypothetical protein
MWGRTFLFTGAMLLTGCSGMTSIVVPDYLPTPRNLSAVRSLQTSGIGVGAFEKNIDPQGMRCRLDGLIVPPEGDIASYVRGALRDELVSASVYAPTDPRITLQGTITDVYLNSPPLTEGNWRIGATIRSSNGREMHVDVIRTIEWFYVGQKACAAATAALNLAVQDLIGAVVRSPDFPALIK